MLINFTDSYIQDISLGFNMLGKIQCVLAEKEPFVGHAKELDEMYGYSVVINGIIEILMYDDNSTPADNEHLLFCLKSLHSKNICGTCKPVISMKNYHNLQPVPVPAPISNLNNF
jgi:hypothetical protein